MMFLFSLVFIIFVDMINDKCEVYTLDTQSKDFASGKVCMHLHSHAFSLSNVITR